MKRSTIAALAGALFLAVPSVAAAHVAVASGPGYAGATQEITFGVGHGCSGADTYRVKIEIPAGVLSVRAERSDFGATTVEKDNAGNVTAVIWEKPIADVLAGDTNYYKLTLRLKVPNAPFTTIAFPTHQTCRTPGGATTEVDWIGAEVPTLQILPAHKPGWNKFTVPAAITNLDVVFADAQIVWKGNAAFSPNSATAELASTTEGVTALTELAANDEIWVKY